MFFLLSNRPAITLTIMSSSTFPLSLVNEQNRHAEGPCEGGERVRIGDGRERKDLMMMMTNMSSNSTQGKNLMIIKSLMLLSLSPLVFFFACISFPEFCVRNRGGKEEGGMDEERN